ncbi:MAG: hypothetical protein CMH80_00415 [Nitrospinae bacterium]|nr:hypothetical protein [Nitrospinota bacterium]
MISIRSLILAAVVNLFLFSGPSLAGEATGQPHDHFTKAESSTDYRALAIGAGAVAGLAVLNIVTGGTVLAATIGVGAFAHPAAMAGGAAPAAGLATGIYNWALVAASGVAGGFTGNWLYGE